MGWFRLDDMLPEHDKLDDVTPDAGWLWVMCGCKISSPARRSDGLLTRRTIKDAAHRANVTDIDGAAAVLVAAGLWHDKRTLRKCERCKAFVARLGKLEDGEFYMHDYLDRNPAKDEANQPDHVWKEARRKALSRDRALRDALKVRDRGLCRYCGIRVDFGDRQTDTGGTWDHVDPACPDNTMDSIVVACRGCNREKSDRTPTEAGMPLLPIPGPPADLAMVNQRSVPGQNPDKPGTEPGLTRTGAEPLIGTGRAGDRPRTEPGQKLPALNGNGSSNGNGSHG